MTILNCQLNPDYHCVVYSRDCQASSLSIFHSYCVEDAYMGKKKFFPLQLKPFVIMQCNYMPTGSCSTKKLCTEVFLQGRYRPSAQSFPENARSYGSGFAGTSVGSASHAIHPVLAEAEGSICGLASRNGDSGLCNSPVLLKGPPLAKARRDLRHGAQKEGCHDRCFQQGLGSAVRGQTDLRSLV